MAGIRLNYIRFLVCGGAGRSSRPILVFSVHDDCLVCWGEFPDLAKLSPRTDEARFGISQSRVIVL